MIVEAGRRCGRAPRPGFSTRQRGARRRRKVLSAVLGLTSCPAFIAGLHATGEHGNPWYGLAGAVLAVALLKCWQLTRPGESPAEGFPGGAP